MPGIHRTRPGFDRVAAATDAPATPLGDGIWMSPGWSNTYLVETDDGKVILNTGMGFEGPLHRRAYDGISAAPVHTVILTQGHYDHVGGIDVVKDPDSEVIAQVNFDTWRDDNERLETFRSRNSAFAFIDAILAAMNYAQSVGVGQVAQGRPHPTRLVADRQTLRIGGRQFELIATPGGETFDSLVVWMPEERTLFSGNLFGPLFGHVPNLVTIRGDRYRDALTYIDSLDVVLHCRPERLITGHFDPIEGADRIAEAVVEMQDAMRHVHDETVEGMNVGTDVWTLMRTVRTPASLDVGEGYGQTKWNVRAIWENYAGWFHHRSTTELYGIAPSETALDVVRIAGADELVEAARRRLAGDEPEACLQITDLVLAAMPEHLGARQVASEATTRLADGTDNFWERAWLRRVLTKLEMEQ